MTRTLLSAAPTDRVGRYPKHTWNVASLPFTAQPFMLAPVLPGETLQNLYFESRIVTDPIENPITIWKKEYYFFFCPITALLSDTIRDMFVDPANTDLSATLGIAANDVPYYTAKGGIDYTKRCVQSVWEHYFSDEDDVFANRLIQSADSALHAGIPLVQIRDRFWLDSIMDKDTMTALDGPDPSALTNMQDLESYMAAFEHLRALGIANMTYEDFLRSYGIAVPGKDENKPELLARFTDTQYPSNTIDPTTGVPTSAVSWVFKNSSRDPKFFKEPGFVIGITVTRPKVYFAGLAGSLASHLTRAWDWLPNYLNEAAEDNLPFTSLKNFGPDTGPLGDRTTATDGYWIDMRDLFLYGDQWQNRVAFDPAPKSTGSIHALALPPGNNHHDYKYPNYAMIDALFLGDGAGTSRVREDGYCTLSVKGRQVDYTSGGIASN